MEDYKRAALTLRLYRLRFQLENARRGIARRVAQRVDVGRPGETVRRMSVAVLLVLVTLPVMCQDVRAEARQRRVAALLSATFGTVVGGVLMSQDEENLQVAGRMFATMGFTIGGGLYVGAFRRDVRKGLPSPLQAPTKPLPVHTWNMAPCSR